MKLKDLKSNMDEMMADVAVGSNIQADVAAGKLADHEEQAEEHNNRPQTPPSRTSSQMAAARRSRRNSVQMACERCRKRKIRCSGLPGPCNSCVRLNVTCHDPGRRRDRAQSLLEDRIQRLEALALANKSSSQTDATSIMSIHLNQSQSQTPTIASPQPRYAQQIQTQNLMNLSSSFEDYGPTSPLSSHGWENWPIPGSPACCSDVGPDVSHAWPQVEYFQQYIDSAPPPNLATHRRAQTFPAVTTDNSWEILADDDGPKSAGAFPDIPLIEITSHDFSRPQTPQPQFDEPSSPAGITIPFRSAMLDQDDDLEDSDFELPATASPFAINTSGREESPLEYYGDLLSPLDQPPPTISRRSSNASTNQSYDVSNSTASYVFSGSKTRTHRAQTLPASISSDRETQQYINMIINSPRTRNYTQIYFNTIHLEYPFLDPTTFYTNRSLAYRASGLVSDPSHRRTTIPDLNSSYQTLMVAAIGAMIHHKSRTLASRHVCHAMSLHPQIDMWSSVSGLHCAILLSIYCYLEATISFNDEGDGNDDDLQKPHIVEPSHPFVNLWLHNCQVAAACIDLGMHIALDVDDGSTDFTGIGIQVAVMARNTLRTAYLLDKNISKLRNRPRAFHDADLDQTLILGL